jgi:hypothetical protein
MPNWLKWFKTKQAPASYESLRGSILANWPLERIATYAKPNEPADSPWAMFASAHAEVRTNPSGAKAHLHRILATPNLESRAYLMAWACLRELGESPSLDIAREAQGIVIEVGLEKGVDPVAAYVDRSARYFNQGGGVIVWDAPNTDEVMDGQIDTMLRVARAIAAKTGPLERPHPPLPKNGMVLLNVLTFGGTHIGMGPMQAMMGDQFGKHAIPSGLALMLALMQQAKSGRATGGHDECTV